jgi:23S rRNA pseudouridine1911/1915/1917 synthase
VRVPESAQGERLDRFVGRTLGYSRAVIQRWMKQGLVTEGGQRVEASDSARAGSEIRVEVAPPLPSKAEPDPNVVFGVVYEDEHLVVVDKPAGLVVHPGKGNWTGTLVNGLVARPGFSGAPVDARDPEGPLRPGIVHRIDKDTSGLLVVAKNERAREGLMRQLQEHTVDRHYLAICVGIPTEGRIETLHGRHATNRLRFSSKVTSGKRAVTHVEVLQRFAGVAALLRCRLETGRTHQIRVHLAEQCHAPLLADRLYGPVPRAPLRSIAERLARHALHAARLGFVHPVTGQALGFDAPLPADLEAALHALGQLESERP